MELAGPPPSPLLGYGRVNSHGLEAAMALDALRAAPAYALFEPSPLGALPAALHQQRRQRRRQQAAAAAAAAAQLRACLPIWAPLMD